MQLCGKLHALVAVPPMEYVPRYLLNRTLDMFQICLNVFRKIRVTCCYHESHHNPPVVKSVACQYADRHIVAQKVWPEFECYTAWTFTIRSLYSVGHDSSVGTAARYGLGVPGIESQWGRDIPHPSRLTLGLTQPSIKWITGLFPGVKRPGRGVDHPLHLKPRSKKA
jgi:hypothetical protein